MASSDSDANPKALQAIYFQAVALKNLIYQDVNFDAESAINQYDALKAKLLEIDKSANGHLPSVAYENWDLYGSLSSARIAVNQLCAYKMGKFVEHPKPSKPPDTQAVAGPVVNFLMMLPEYGLTIKWAVAAAMLSSLEVITNMNLTKFRILYDPNEPFDRRVNKLKNALTSKDIELPALLLSALYKVRNKVIHEGKEPTTEEMATIFDLLTSLNAKAK